MVQLASYKHVYSLAVTNMLGTIVVLPMVVILEREVYTNALYIGPWTEIAKLNCLHYELCSDLFRNSTIYEVDLRY